MDPALDYLSTGLGRCSTPLPQADELAGRQRAAKGGSSCRRRQRGSRRSRTAARVTTSRFSAGWTKFSNNQAVRAANFKAAIDRDRGSEDAVAVDAVHLGHRRRRGKAGLRREGQGDPPDHHPDRPAPDFLARIAMPFFCAVPTNLRTTRTASRSRRWRARTTSRPRDNKSISIKRNPNYKGKRPHNVDQINWTIGNSPEATQLRIQNGADGLAAAASRRRPTRSRRRSTASTRGGSSSSPLSDLVPRVQP